MPSVNQMDFQNLRHLMIKYQMSLTKFANGLNHFLNLYIRIMQQIFQRHWIIFLIIIMKLLLVSQMLNAFYSRFKAIKKTELERIAAVVLKNCSVSLPSPLCQIFAMPLSLGQLLDQWKISEITPTY